MRHIKLFIFFILNFYFIQFGWADNTLAKAKVPLQPAGMVSLTDEELDATRGQALINLSYIGPSDAGNTNPDIGFYRLGLEAELRLNANIKTLQLGCGGFKGMGCDIDLRDVSLVGVGASSSVVDSGPATDAILNNPFFEVAVKSPESASQREVVGLRFGALEALGKLSLGSNADPANIADDRPGIVSLTGDLNLTIANSSSSFINLTNICVRVLGCPGSTAADLSSCIFLNCVGATAKILPYNANIVVQRQNYLDLTGLSAQTGSISVLGLGLPLGITLPVTIYGQPLSTVHELVIAANSAGTVPTKDFYLSVQNQDINWQKVSAAGTNTGFNGVTAAQKGWWISLPNVQITDLTITQRVTIPVGDVLGGIAQTPVNLNPVDLGQRPIDNCWGSLTFC